MQRPPETLKNGRWPHEALIVFHREPVLSFWIAVLRRPTMNKGAILSNLETPFAVGQLLDG
jgi:hypothetical protein